MSLLDGVSKPAGEFFGWALPDAPDLAATVARAYESRKGEADPMRSLSVAGLIEAAERAGFDDISVSVTAISRACTPGDDTAVNRVLNAQPNPNVPAVTDAARQMLEPAQSARFLGLLERAVREGHGRIRQSTALLTARKPR